MENSANDAAAAPAAAQNQEAAQQSEDAGVQTGAGSDSVGGASTAGGSTTMARKSAWGSAKTVLVGVKAAGRFQTLRDLIGDDAYIEESRLKMMKALGEGAFAKVQQAGGGGGGGGSDMLARQSIDGRPRIVAVKILRQELLVDPEQVQLFLKEVSLLRKLRHRHIVRFVGCSWDSSLAEESAKGTMPQEMYYVQEFCAGGSLGDLVRKQMVNPFKKLYTDMDALRWCKHIALALQYLHEARPVVIHRDLKLENVMVTSEATSEAEVKLGDFGLARLTPPAEKEKMERLTRMLSQPRKDWSTDTLGGRSSGKNVEKMLDRMLTNTTVRSERSIRTSNMSATPSILSSSTTWAEVSHRALTGKTGSFGYMAPEVSRNQQYDAQADIFSLGMCMYNLFNRTIPTVQILLNGDESHLELYAAKVADGYRPPMLATVPPSVQDAINACWKGSAQLRPTARAVVEMLEAIEASGEIKANAAQSKAAGGCSCTVM